MSKENTVTISLTLYNRLRAFKESIKRKEFVVYPYYGGNIFYCSTEEFESKTLEILRKEKDEEITRLKEDVKQLNLQIKEANNKKGCFWCGKKQN